MVENSIAKFWSELQNTDQVLKSYQTAVDISPEYYKINNNYGGYLMSEGNLSKAFHYLIKSSEIFQYDYKVYKNLIKLMIRADQYDTAIEYIKHSKRIRKYIDKDLYELEGKVYSELKDCDNAIKSLRVAEQIAESERINNTSKTNTPVRSNDTNIYKEFCYEYIMQNPKP